MPKGVRFICSKYLADGGGAHAFKQIGIGIRSEVHDTDIANVMDALSELFGDEAPKTCTDWGFTEMVRFVHACVLCKMPDGASPSFRGTLPWLGRAA